MPELTKKHLEILRRDKEVEVIIKKNNLLKNDDSYGKILDGIKKAYEEGGEAIPEDELTLVVEIVSTNILPTDDLEQFYYKRAKYAHLKGGGRRKRKSRKKKSRKRKSKKRKSKKKKNRTRRRRR
jgi:hypothetical protein